MDDFNAPHPMLRLPLRRPAGCGCVVVALVIMALLIVLGGSYFWIKDREWIWPPPRAALVTSAAQITIMPSLTAMPSPTDTSLPTATSAPSLATATLSPPVPTDTPVPLPTATNTPPPTHTPTATSTRAPTATATRPRITPTHTPTATSTSLPTATRPAPVTVAGAVACSAQIKEVIELAAEAQAQYIEGTAHEAALAAAWGGASADARQEAEQLLAHLEASAPGGQVEDVVWTVLDCQMQSLPGWVRVTTSERWTYRVVLECAPGGQENAVRIEFFPSQVYALSRNGETWRIDSWLTGPADVETEWRCPS